MLSRRWEIVGEHGEPGNIKGDGSFLDLHPSETAGDGRIVENNIISGLSQGGGGSPPAQKVSCLRCGFYVDLSKTAISKSKGNEETGRGGLSEPVATDVSGTLPNGSTITDTSLETTVNTGIACSFCGSMNFTKLSARKSPRIKTRIYF